MEKEKIICISSHSKKIKIDDIHKLIDKLLALNDIFQISLNNYILFEEADKDDYKQMINYLFFKFDLTSIKMALSKEIKIFLSYK